MKQIYEILDKVLDRFAEDKDNDTYHRTLYIPSQEDPECDDEVDFFEEIKKAMDEIGITQWDYINCGGFDSPGYDISCYCISYIDLEGRLQQIPVAFECY